MDTFNENVFRTRVDKALGKVKTILDNTRNPQYPTDVHHEYEDKYVLSEFLATSAIATFLNSLEFLGLTGKNWEQVKEWSKQKNVTLRLRADESCKFLKKVVRTEESDKNVTKAGIFGTFSSFTATKITEYLWEYTVKWELVAFAGVDSENAVVLQSHNGTTELKTLLETPPKPQNLVRPPIDINITWLLQNTDDTKTPKFAIDRNSKKCHTPRRNAQVEDALTFFYAFHIWGEEVCRYFKYTIFPEQLNHGYDLSALNAESIFVPVLPLFEDPSPSTSSSSSSTTSSTSSHALPKIPPVFANSFLAEQAHSMEEKRKELAKAFPQNAQVITLTEANVVVTLLHLNRVTESYSEGVDFIEDMLYKQLVAAIGKVVTPVDFSNYLAFHNRKIFNEAYRPQAFSYAIRRPEHYPEGVLSIEAQLDDGILSSPITTIVAERKAAHPMRFSLNAATKVSFYGDRYLHGYVSHQFAGYSGTELSLYARARQFSSFILLVGRIVSADLFEPKYATIIQNKDELKIPLLLETIPTPKEFKDAIASLSPEQQRFCKAFRSMQLESTLFGVCVIQIKPQLEKLLKLPDDSLTKEIQLSQDLLNLFIKYQIPSDLVSYDGAEGESVEFKTGRVREFVARMHAMLDASKKAELVHAQQEQEMRMAQEEVNQIDRLESSEIQYKSETMRNQAVMFKKNATQVKSQRWFSLVPSLPSFGSASMSGPPDSSGSVRVSNAAPPFPKSSALPMNELVMSDKAVAVKDSGFFDAKIPEPAPEPHKKQSLPDKEIAQKGAPVGDIGDYTKIPAQLEQKFEEFDESNALRPTIINPGKTWNKTFYASLLSEAEKKTVDTEEQEKEKNKAFDLLDALTKSGALSIDYASLHVVIASTHCFDKSIIHTVIQDNINPIEKVENSSLIVASTIHQTPPVSLIAPEHLDRIGTTSAKLLGSDKDLIEM
eukprot:Phypoly_transcript_02212.p1 GENE.Phypoly_transcript_02212~~Phypoly_transcript_02212.p1  ORF type:complete len:944 (+),score=196.07 Phypoly_transcript_02212:68-2899(+)